MTSSDPPDPRLFPTWESAFVYPIPVVRRFEGDLRKHVDENRTKLRSLVGSRYRDLLGTAETIVAMHHDISRAENLMVRIGMRCNGAVVERSVRNLRDFERKNDAMEEKNNAKEEGVEKMRKNDGDESGQECKGKEAMRRDAQIRILGDVLSAATRIVRSASGNLDRMDAGHASQSRGGALLAAKLLVLARLLLKHLMVDQGATRTDLLETLRKKLMGSRKRLLAFIDRRIASGSSQDVTRKGDDESEGEKAREEERRVERLTDTLAAYELINSASPADVLRYFLRTRSAHIAAAVEGGASSEQQMRAEMHYYGQTLTDARLLFPNRLTEALMRLGRGPLLQDQGVMALHELNLDVYGIWLPEEIRSFTPWVRHDELALANVHAASKSWATQAQTALIDLVRNGLKVLSNPDELLRIRYGLLSQFLQICTRHPREHSLIQIDRMRQTFNSRFQELTTTLTSRIELDFDEDDETKPPTAESLWDLANADLQTQSGGHRLRNAILQRRHGRGSGLQISVSRLNAWTDSLDSLWTAVESMGQTRWTDIDFDELEEGIEADEGVQMMLNKFDPDSLGQAIRTATTASLTRLYDSVQQAARATKTSSAKLLRLLREVDERHQQMSGYLPADEQLNVDIPSTASDLHQRLAVEVLEEPCEVFSSSKVVTGQLLTSLWDGEPPLPVQPHPRTFGLLMSVQKGMADMGSDLWSQTAVTAIKEVLAQRMGLILRQQHESLPSQTVSSTNEPSTAEQTNGQTPVEENQDKTRSHHVAIQLLFDAVYLQHVTVTTGVSSTIDDLARSILQDVGLAAEAEKRLRKNASEYWRRTYLLFAHLAG